YRTTHRIVSDTQPGLHRPHRPADPAPHVPRSPTVPQGPRDDIQGSLRAITDRPSQLRGCRVVSAKGSTPDPVENAFDPGVRDTAKRLRMITGLTTQEAK